jgi:regulator of sirC expression with transglutaminase-like and TPR domain
VIDLHEPLLDDVRRFSTDPDADEFAAALLVNRALDDTLDLAGLSGRVQRLIDDCSEPERPWLYLADLGFGGDADSYGVLDNSRLDWLLEQRRGIPISLGVLLIHLARSLGHAAVGINFPGHFLVRVNQQLVDPFRMIGTSESECLAGLSAQGYERGQNPPAVDVFREASPLAVLQRMLNNLKYHFAQHSEWHRALDMIDLQLAVDPQSAALTLERGELWWRLGAVVSAREAFERAVLLAEGRDAEIVNLAQARMRALGGDDRPLH